VPVFTDLPGYRAAVASLAVSTVPADAAAGAVVVLSGDDDWWDGVLAAQAAGAAAVVVAAPLAAPSDAVQVLLDSAGVPVLLERPRLRPDVVRQLVDALADASPSLVTVECSAVASEAAAVIHDALGWARAIGRGRLDLQTASTTLHGSIGLLRASGADRPLDITLMVNVVNSGKPGGFLRLTCLGEVLATITVDVPAGVASLDVATAKGALRLPACFEATERLTLRRALQALGDGQSPADLAGLLGDSQLSMSFLPDEVGPPVQEKRQRTIGTFFG
jgi:hypothetical protein